jgi:HEAT repeat protein
MRKRILEITLLSAFALPVSAMQVPPVVNVQVNPQLDRTFMELSLALSKLNLQPMIELAAARLEMHMPRIEHTLAQLEMQTPVIDRALMQLQMNMPMIEHSLMMNMPQIERSLMELEMRLPLLLSGINRDQMPPESWDAQDPADSLWTAARTALNRGNYAQAATMYHRLRTDARFVRSTYRDDAYYWEADARQRVGTPESLRQARQILRDLRRDHPRYENMENVSSLEGQINAALASNGDQQAVQQTQQAVQNVVGQQCPDTEEKEAALMALMGMPGQASLPVLKQVMAKRDACSADLRAHAVMLITRIESPEVEPILIDAATNDPNEDVRQHAVFWLASRGSERSIGVVEQIIRTSTDEDMIQMALMSLSRHNTPRTTQLIRDLATRTNVNPDVRAYAIHYLGQRGDAESAALLRSLWPTLTDEDSKTMALMGIARNKAAGNEDFLMSIVNNASEPEDVRTMAFHSLTQSQNLAPARLGEMYDRSTSEDMKQMIIMALARSTDTTALDQLIRIGRAEKDSDLRQHIIMSVGRHSNDPRAVRFLTEIIGGGDA